MTPSDEERAFWNTATYLPDAVRVDVGSPEMEDLRYALAVLEQLTT